MPETGSGLLALLSPALIASLLRGLPKAEVEAEGLPLGDLEPQYQQLQTAAFSGYALLKLGGETAWLAFLHGQPLWAWRQTAGGYLVGAAAYRSLQAEAGRGLFSLYRLAPEALPPVLAVTLGGLRAAALPASSLIAAEIFASLGQEGFEGVVVLEGEYGLRPRPGFEGDWAGRAWYFREGELLFGAELPGSFRQGRLHLANAPAKLPPSLLETLRQEEQQGQAQRLEALWNAAGAVLREYMGRGAAPALERLQRTHPTEDPDSLSVWLQSWLETRLEPNAAEMFERLAKD